MHDNFGIRLSLVDCCKRMYDRGLVGGTQGNASVRIDSDRILISPTGSNLGYLKPHDLTVISLAGRKLSGECEPSSEYLLHLGIYKHREDINAVCHAHPIAVTACAIVDLDLNRLILPEIAFYLKNIAIIKYGTPGTPELFERLAPLVGESEVFILKNHGAVTLGTCPEDAFNRMEILERYAQTLIYANQLGTIKQIPVKPAHKIPGSEPIEGQFAG